MRITLNGQALALDFTEGESLGELLARADDLIEKAGSVIVELAIDGVALDADGYSRAAERSAAEEGKVEIRAEPASAIRVKALDTLIELLSLAKASSVDDGTGASDWQALRSGAVDLRDAFSGLFSADELSFVSAFSELLANAGDSPDLGARIEIAAQCERLASLFGDRLAEILDPAKEMRGAAALFAARAEELGELPVLLQTGKEDRAMKAVLYFIEVFNKVIRILPELRRSGLDTDSIRVEGADLAGFYGSFNKVLRSLTEAFEHKDAILIGDLAEYEVLPRMKSFFAAMEEALPTP
jgi:hypothetical protein